MNIGRIIRNLLQRLPYDRMIDTPLLQNDKYDKYDIHTTPAYTGTNFSILINRLCRKNL